jgi:ferric-dicitrate binding protein FerR (iron transport regulator)
LKEKNKYLELFGKYCSGNCSETERFLFEEELKKSTEFRSEFEEYKKVWNYTGIKKEGNTVLDLDSNWKELNKRINAVETLTQEIFESKFAVSKKIVYTFARIAAVIIFAFGLFFLFNQLNNEQTRTGLTQSVAETQVFPVLLSDGSEVILNKGSRISYPEEFTDGKRMVNFEGNAFFNITPDPEKPFIINSGELQIEVLGTSFNFCTCPESDEMILCLESGKVRFSSINPQSGQIVEQIILTPGQKGMYNKKTGVISRSEIKNQNYLAWKTGLLVFEKTSLDEVLQAIEQNYNLKIISEKSFEDLSLTARFNNETAESIFESLQAIFGIQYTINGQTVILN